MEYKTYKTLTFENENDILKSWLACRKRTKQEYATIGDFKFPGFWTVQNYKNDCLMLGLAIFFEILFLTLVFSMAGVQTFLIIMASVSVVIDIVGAYWHHSKRSDISVAQLKHNIEEYLHRIGKRALGSVTDKEKSVAELKNSPFRILGVVVIILSYFVKIFVAGITFHLPIIVFASVVIFGFVAYIHLYHTGYAWVAWRKFYPALDKKVKKHRDIRPDTLIDDNDDFKWTKIEEIPVGITLLEIKRRIFSQYEIYDCIVKIEDEWNLKIWKHQFWDDADMLNFINSSDSDKHSLSDKAKAFVASEICSKDFLRQIK